MQFLALSCGAVISFVSTGGGRRPVYQPRACDAAIRMATPPWDALAARLHSLDAPHPPLLDTVLTSSTSAPTGLTLFRERHGWCPYSEKVWLALELKGLDYSTVLIDNTGGGRPSWYGGQTPQIQWADGRTQGESMDIVKKLDVEYPESRQLYPPPGVSMSDVASMISAFRGAFPSNARPSSRAAYLFTYGGPLGRSDFEKALDATEKVRARSGGGGCVARLTLLLARLHPRAPFSRSSPARLRRRRIVTPAWPHVLTGPRQDSRPRPRSRGQVLSTHRGPFFCGSSLSAADVSWCPFLERYAAQLPCLHEGLLPRDASRWPRLAEWYEAMDEVREAAGDVLRTRANHDLCYAPDPLRSLTRCGA